MGPKVFKNLLEKRKGKVIQKRSKQVATKKKKKKCDEEGHRHTHYYRTIKEEKMGGRRLATRELLYDSHSKIGGETVLIKPKERTNYSYERNEKGEHECQEQEVCSESVDSCKRSHHVNGMETSRSKSSTSRSYEPDILTQNQAQIIEMQREIIAELREKVELCRQFMERRKIGEEMMMKRQEEISQQIAAFQLFQSLQNRNSNLSNQSRDLNDDDKSGGGGGVGGAGV